MSGRRPIIGGRLPRGARADVVSLTADTVSIMPEGFKELGQEKLEDVVKFLTTVEPKKEN